MPTAILVDGDLFIRRYRYLFGKQRAQKVAGDLHRMCLDHLKQTDGKRDLYRFFFYDCPPLTKKAHNPINGRTVDFSRMPTAIGRTVFPRTPPAPAHTSTPGTRRPRSTRDCPPVRDLVRGKPQAPPQRFDVW